VEVIDIEQQSLLPSGKNSKSFVDKTTDQIIMTSGLISSSDYVTNFSVGISSSHWRHWLISLAPIKRNDPMWSTVVTQPRPLDKARSQRYVSLRPPEDL